MARSNVIQGIFPGGVRVAQPKAAMERPAWVLQAIGRAPSPAATMQPSPAGQNAFRLPPHAANFQRGGAGQPLPVGVRQLMEHAFSTSFADVRIHVGPQAPSIGATAFTCGTDVYFAAGQYDPATPAGRGRLAHELTHVVQQRVGRVRNPFGNALAVVQNQALEAEADRMSAVVQRYVPPVEFLRYVDALISSKRVDVNEERLFYWNALGKFDAAYDAVTRARDDATAAVHRAEVLVKMAEWNAISINAGGGPLLPGQVHERERLPNYLDYFADRWRYALPHGLGHLRFEKRFDRITAHGWISTNVELPAGALGSRRKLIVHMIIAVREPILNDVVLCNPHVTVRLKAVQDHLTMITMLNDLGDKTREMRILGTAAADHSISIGLASERMKEEAGAVEALGVDPAQVRAAFTNDWIAGVVPAAEAAARAQIAAETAAAAARAGGAGAGGGSAAAAAVAVAAAPAAPLLGAPGGLRPGTFRVV